MKRHQTRFWTTARAALLAVFLTACGGGVGSGGTGTFTYGPVTGFGSVIVSGIRFDDSQARVEDDTGSGRGREALKLGMVVAVESDAVAATASGRQATAATVRFGSVLVGPVTSIDVAGGSLVAVGQTVKLTSITVFDDSLGGPSAVQAGRLIEVHGFVDAATQSIIATRVESADATVASYKVRGAVTELDTAAKTLRIGADVFNYAAATDVPSDLANSKLVTVRLKKAQAAGRWDVISFGTVRLSQPQGERDQADIRGVVTSLTSSARFVLNDTAIDASKASFPDGTAGLVVGARAKAEGKFDGGTLIADKVEIDSDSKIIGDGIDLRGAIESVDAAAKTFKLRGSTVYYGGSVRFDKGSEADLKVGREVRVKGVLSTDRTRVEATRIEF